MEKLILEKSFFDRLHQPRICVYKYQWKSAICGKIVKRFLSYRPNKVLLEIHSEPFFGSLPLYLRRREYMSNWDLNYSLQKGKIRGSLFIATMEWISTKFPQTTRKGRHVLYFRISLIDS